MYARIGQSTTIRQTFRYNEEKLRKGAAELLLSDNFVKDSRHLTREDKLDRFEQRNSLNERTPNNILPISLNFDIADKISNEQMQRVAKRYMEAIGFERQPYLAYRHYDAGHPHCHIITTKITEKGEALFLTPSDLLRSHQVTKEIEQEFSLVKRQKQEDGEQFRVTQAQRVVYGQSSLKHSISDVLNTVVDHYKYTSLQELNAVLRLYHVKADRGSENSRLYQTRGLIYHAIDENGRRQGKQIKASDFFLKPTLANLEKRFAHNVTLQQENQQRMKTAIDWSLAGTTPDWKGFQQSMEREGIDIVLQPTKKDGPQALFFVDHNTKSVFAGETLGSQYLLESIRQRCAPEQNQDQDQDLEESHRHRLRLG